jgi:hypothetical protein
MIRYTTIRGNPLTLKTLRAAIKADVTNHPDPDVRKAVKGWLKKAKARTAQLIAAGAYIDKKKWDKLPAKQKVVLPEPISVEWGSVKHVFMEVQNEKCAYCERKLAAETSKGGKGEHHVEHFRPKSSVKSWSAPASINFVTGGPSVTGYYWLAFNLLNYCTACTTCNSGYKHDYFPISGARGIPGSPPGGQLNTTEQPFLLYPLGKVDDDPEDVIRFRGITAFPPDRDPLLPPKDRKNAHRNRRARVVIELFALNTREELLFGRAVKLRELDKSLAIKNDPKAEKNRKADANRDIKQLLDGS